MVNALILVKNVATAASVATSVVVPGTVVATTTLYAMRALNVFVYCHYVVYAARLASKFCRR